MTYLIIESASLLNEQIILFSIVLGLLFESLDQIRGILRFLLRFIWQSRLEYWFLKVFCGLVIVIFSSSFYCL